MPPLEAEEYLFRVFLEIGLVSHVGRGMGESQTDGMIPLLWSEISAFGQLNWGIAGWEASALRDMSREYIRGIMLGTNPLGIPPWEDAPKIMIRTKGASK